MNFHDFADPARTPAYFYEGNSRFVEGGRIPDGEDGFSCGEGVAALVLKNAGE